MEVSGILAALNVCGQATIAYLQDRFGRKFAFYLCLFCYLIGSTISIFMPNMWAFAAVHSIACFGFSMLNVGMAWGLEFLGKKYRTRVSLFFNIAYCLGTAMLSLISFLCRDWLHFTLITTVPFCAIVIQYFIISESPRWLYTHGKMKEADECIRRMIAWQKEPRLENTWHVSQCHLLYVLSLLQLHKGDCIVCRNSSH